MYFSCLRRPKDIRIFWWKAWFLPKFIYTVKSHTVNEDKTTHCPLSFLTGFYIFNFYMQTELHNFFGPERWQPRAA